MSIIEELPAWVGELSSLRKLSLPFCAVRRLFDTPDECLPLLEELHLNRCQQLEGLPSWVARLSRLRVLTVGTAALHGALSPASAVETLPAWTDSLEILTLDKSLREEMRGLGWVRHLRLLRDLDLSYVTFLPDDEPAEGCLQLLGKLNLFQCSGIEELPAWIGRLPRLRCLQATSSRIRNCSTLVV